MKNNKKGFTLIELVVTIALLAIIVLITSPAIIGLLDKNKKSNCDSLKRSVLESAKLYVSDNRYSIPWTGSNPKTATISAETLIEKKYFDKNTIPNPCDDSDPEDDYSNKITIKLEKDKNNNISYTISLWPSIFDCCTSE